MHQHRPCLLRFGFKPHVFRDMCLPSSWPIPGPFYFWQVESTIEKGMPSATAITQDCGYLSVLQLACCSQVLTCDPDRVGPFLEKAGLIHYGDPLLRTYGLDDKLLQPIACRIRIPGHPIQQSLHA